MELTFSFSSFYKKRLLSTKSVAQIAKHIEGN
jgi:hypothetical protein